MSHGWAQLLDVDRLADGRAEYDFQIPLAELPRLSASLVPPAGAAHVSAHFRRDRGTPIVAMRATACAPLECQRCRGRVEIELDGDSQIALVETFDEADGVPEGIEPLLIEGGRVSLRDLVDEELLLALPLVAMHAEGDPACRPESGAERVAEPARAEEPAETTQTPFADLARLMRRKDERNE